MNNLSSVSVSSASNKRIVWPEVKKFTADVQFFDIIASLRTAGECFHRPVDLAGYLLRVRMIAVDQGRLCWIIKGTISDSLHPEWREVTVYLDEWQNNAIIEYNV